MVEGWRKEIKHQMATDLESLKVTIKEMEREIRRVEGEGGGRSLREQRGNKEVRDMKHSESCNFVQSKCISPKTCCRETRAQPQYRIHLLG